MDKKISVALTIKIAKIATDTIASTKVKPDNFVYLMPGI